MIITNYDGQLPFHHYLKNVFRKNRSFGSTDRKIYRAWSYAWFRFGNACRIQDFENRIFLAYYLVNGINDSLSEELAQKYFMPSQIAEKNSSLDFRVEFLAKHISEFDINEIAPDLPELSGNLKRNEFIKSILNQPSVFIRIRNNYQKDVIDELNNKNIPYINVKDPENCVAVPPGTNLDQLKSALNKYFEIQDRSSQYISLKIPAIDNEKLWDCCCGAGGKSLALLDRVKNIHLLATDLRQTVIDNFSSRITNDLKNSVELMQLDLKDPLPSIVNERMFDGVIADVPCTGSGTWPRTPEQLTAFSKEDLAGYQKNQRAILGRIAGNIKPCGWLFYSTCSVFRSENEDQVRWAVEDLNLKLSADEFVSGVENNCDSMYYAILYK